MKFTIWKDVMRMRSTDKKYITVDKFLGVNQAIDGETELKAGEASKCENWYITDGANLETRPGVRKFVSDQRTPGYILAAWSGKVGTTEYLCVVDFREGADHIYLLTPNGNGGKQIVHAQHGALGMTDASCIVKVFSFAGYLYVMSEVNTVRWNGSSFVSADYYVPKVVTGAPPAGGGTTLEKANLLTNKRRLDYSADGTATKFVLPKEAKGVDWAKVDGTDVTGTWNASDHSYTFSAAPVKGVGNVEIQYFADAAGTAESYAQIAKCRLSEAYNGSTDTRLFVAGDGTNRLYYTGVPNDKDMSFLYFPAMYEIAVDMSASPVMAMVRHYSRLLVFKPDGTFTVSYDSLTLPDGTLTAGFHLQPANREYGSDIYGQVQTVDNFPWTVTKGGIYSWNITASYYKDERYARRVSEKVRASLRNADIDRIVTCDDNYTHTYYAFLNDDAGTVLVCRYSILSRDNIWFTYKSDCFKNVRYAVIHDGTMTIVTGNGELCFFDNDFAYDEAIDGSGERVAIKSLWESGYQPFGIDYRRKSSSIIYVSCIPKGASKLTITAATDRKSGDEGYTEKVVSNSLFSFSTMRFSTMSFNSMAIPKINRIKLKVKKFVYYKLIFRADEPGCHASVLAYDQEIRLSGMAK